MRNIRRATAQDVAAIESLENALFSDPWSERSIAETIEERQAEIFVVEQEKVIAYAIVYFAATEMELARIGVACEEQRNGVGKTLMSFLCVWAREKGLQDILLDVREGNAKARHFYETYGFHIDGQRKHFYDNPDEDAILMSLSLVE